jgi:hypothetical protein
MNLWHDAGWFAKLTLMIDLVPLVMAVVYVLRPTDHHLALMRPLSLAGLFSALTGPVIGSINLLRAIGLRPDAFANSYGAAAVGAAEALVPMFVGFAALTAAWLLVAAGMARSARAGENGRRL